MIRWEESSAKYELLAVIPTAYLKIVDLSPFEIEDEREIRLDGKSTTGGELSVAGVGSKLNGLISEESDRILDGRTLRTVFGRD